MKPFVSHLLMPSCHTVSQTLWHRFAAVPLLFGAAMSIAQTLLRFIRKLDPQRISSVRILSSAVFPSWPGIKPIFLSSIYRIKLNVYYYRWRVAHQAQKYTGAKNGWIVTEFLSPVFYSAPYRFKSEVTK